MDHTNIAAQKAALRGETERWLSAFPPARRRDSDRALLLRLSALPELCRAETVFLFIGMGTEPDTLPLIRRLYDQGKRVALPRCLPHWGLACHLYHPDRPLVRHPYGMLEPPPDAPLVSRGEIGFALIPALRYDRAGFRLGHGGGYYDRWLSGFPGDTAGLCRDALLQDRLPTESHDLAVSSVITETLTLRPSG